MTETKEGIGFHKWTREQFEREIVKILKEKERCEIGVRDHFRFHSIPDGAIIGALKDMLARGVIEKLTDQKCGCSNCSIFGQWTTTDPPDAANRRWEFQPVFRAASA